MPELPEVETIKRQLAPHVTGRTIVRVSVLDPLLTKPMSPRAFNSRLAGCGITAVSRRGKYLRFELDDGAMLVIHLRMTGILVYLEKRPRGDLRHMRLLLGLDDGSWLAMRDARRFGKALVLESGEIEPYWRRLGPEPLERSFDRRVMARIVSGRRKPVKSTLLDQQLIAGIGNIYADEALFRAGIHPERPAGSLSDKEIADLTISIKETLRHAIRLQGSSIDTYRDARGSQGRFQDTFRVHRRAGLPCPRCGGVVEKIRVGGRGTYFCPCCQKR